MKKALATSAYISLVLVSGTSFAEQANQPATDEEKIGYSLGYQMGSNFVQQGAVFNTEYLFKGIEDAMAGSTPLLNDGERKNALTNLKNQLVELRKQKLQEQSAQNLTASNAFLASNKEKAGVVTTDSGLQYKELVSGTGKTPKAEDRVTVHYTGKLINGTEFDSSVRRGKPAEFQVDKVIPGWSEALLMMQEGDKWELFIPPELGYGAKGAGAKIPPNSALIFEVELIAVH